MRLQHFCQSLSLFVPVVFHFPVMFLINGAKSCAVHSGSKIDTYFCWFTFEFQADTLISKEQNALYKCNALTHVSNFCKHDPPFLCAFLQTL